MASPYKYLPVTAATHHLAKALSSEWGLSIEEAVLAGLVTLDRQKGGKAARIMADRVAAIRTKMREAAGRADTVRRVAASRGRRNHGAKGSRFDHSVWKWQDLEVGQAWHFKEGLHHGAYLAAMRFRSKHSGWNIKKRRVADGYEFERVS